MLTGLAFLESERRSRILDGGKLARVHVFRNRLPMMHRHGWTGNRTPSSTAFAWFVWDIGHSGPATIDRISWEREPYGTHRYGTRRVRLRTSTPRRREQVKIQTLVL